LGGKCSGKNNQLAFDKVLAQPEIEHLGVLLLFNSVTTFYTNPYSEIDVFSLNLQWGIKHLIEILPLLVALKVFWGNMFLGQI